MFSDWPVLVGSLPSKGLVRELASQTEFVSFDDGNLSLIAASDSLLNEPLIKKLEHTLQVFLNFKINLSIQIGSVKDTASLREKKRKIAFAEKTRRLIMSDPMVAMLLEDFDGEIINYSIREKD